jgi:hypothetical protein
VSRMEEILRDRVAGMGRIVGTKEHHLLSALRNDDTGFRLAPAASESVCTSSASTARPMSVLAVPMSFTWSGTSRIRVGSRSACRRRQSHAEGQTRYGPIPHCDAVNPTTHHARSSTCVLLVKNCPSGKWSVATKPARSSSRERSHRGTRLRYGGHSAAQVPRMWDHLRPTPPRLRDPGKGPVDRRQTPCWIPFASVAGSASAQPTQPDHRNDCERDTECINLQLPAAARTRADAAATRGPCGP